MSFVFSDGPPKHVICFLWPRSTHIERFPETSSGTKLIYIYRCLIIISLCVLSVSACNGTETSAHKRKIILPVAGKPNTFTFRFPHRFEKDFEATTLINTISMNICIVPHCYHVLSVIACKWHRTIQHTKDNRNASRQQTEYYIYSGFRKRMKKLWSNNIDQHFQLCMYSYTLFSSSKCECLQRHRSTWKNKLAMLEASNLNIYFSDFCNGLEISQRKNIPQHSQPSTST